MAGDIREKHSGPPWLPVRNCSCPCTDAVFFLCEARNKGAEESLDEYTAALKAEAKGIDSYYVQVCSAWSQYTRWDGREQCINNAGIVAGLYGIAGVAQSIGRVDTFSISEAKMTPAHAGGH